MEEGGFIVLEEMKDTPARGKLLLLILWGDLRESITILFNNLLSIIP